MRVCLISYDMFKSRIIYFTCFFGFVAPTVSLAQQTMDDGLSRANVSLVQNDAFSGLQMAKAWIKPKIIFTSIHKSTSFRCFVIVEETIFFEWHFESRIISKSTTDGQFIVEQMEPIKSVETLHQSKLTITNITSDIVGHYSCQIHGIGSRSITLNSKLLLSSFKSEFGNSPAIDAVFALVILVPFLFGTIIILKFKPMKYSFPFVI